MLPRRSARNSADGLATSARPAVGHLEHADLVGGAEAVLDRAQDAELVAAVAFEIQHRVHHVLQHARPGERAVLGDVADQHQRESPRSWPAGSVRSRRRAPGATVPGALSIAVQPHGLDRVDHHQRRRRSACSSAAAMSRTLIAAASSQRRVVDAEPAGAQADLVDRIPRRRHTARAGRRGRARRRPAAAAWICRCPDRRRPARPRPAPGRRPARGPVRRCRWRRAAAARRCRPGRRTRVAVPRGGLARPGRAGPRRLPRRWCSIRRRSRSARPIWG